MKPSSQSSSPLEYVQVEEQKRLNIARDQGVPWKKWGPYLSGVCFLAGSRWGTGGLIPLRSRCVRGCIYQKKLPG